MEDPKTPDIRSILRLEGLYWTTSEDESSITDSASSRSGRESPSSNLIPSKQEDILPIKEQAVEKTGREDEDEEKIILQGFGLSSPEIPHPTTPSKRVTRFIPDSPISISKRIYSPLPDPYASPIPTTPTNRTRHRRLTFDRVLDLSLIQSRTCDSESPKPKFGENGDVVVLLPTTGSPPTEVNSSISVWQSRLSAPAKGKKYPSFQAGVNGDFMASEGGLGLGAATWGL